MEKSFAITLNEWKTKTENRAEHHFKNSFYKDVTLEKLRTLYNGSVPCVSSHYLRKKSVVLKVRRSDMKFYEGYVNVYCSHVYCCHCAVTGKVDLFRLLIELKETSIFQVKDHISLNVLRVGISLADNLNL